MRIRVSGTNKVIMDISQFAAFVPEKLQDAAEQICEDGEWVANLGYAAVQYSQYDPGITTEVRSLQNGAELVATGDGLMFIEFGTGIYSPEHPLQNEIPGIVPHGEYGQGKGASPPWVYYGDPGTNGHPIPGKTGVSRTYGDPPARAMFDASQTMREEAIDVIKEVTGL